MFQKTDGVLPSVTPATRPPPIPARSRPLPPLPRRIQRPPPCLPPPLVCSQLPPSCAPPPPPVVPRSRPAPPPTPPRSMGSKAQLSSSLNNAQPQTVSNLSSTDQNTERRQSLNPPLEFDDQKQPPPRPQAPNNVKKCSVTSITESPRKKNFKIPPPLQTQPLQEDEKQQLTNILLQNDSMNGSSGKISIRQDSNVSSDSFSQNSSPSYTTKSMETPLLAQCGKKSKNKYSNSDKKGRQNRSICIGDSDDGVSGTAIDDANNALTKSHSTPASLQAIVRFHHGSNMSIHHRVGSLKLLEFVQVV